MAHVVYDDLDFCVDCTMEIANGDLSGLTDEQAAAHRHNMNLRWGNEPVYLVITCSGGDESCDSFSTVQCDGCGTYLAGERHKGAALSI